MKKLQTIQEENKLNDVFAIDEPGPGGAHHVYAVCCAGSVSIDEKQHLIIDPAQHLATIAFQKGPRHGAHSMDGVLNVDLLEIVRDQLTDFQKGPFACEENKKALINVEYALVWLNKRAKDRAARGVLGTEQK